MKPNNISTKKFILKYGLILGIIWSIYFHIRYATYATYNIHHTVKWFFRSIEIVLHISLIYPIYLYKSLNNGMLKLGVALKIGISISLIASLVWAINIVLVEIIQPEFVIQTLNETQEEMLIKNPNMSPKDIQETIRSNKMLNLFGHIILNLTFGFIVSLIAGAILRKKKKL